MVVNLAPPRPHDYEQRIMTQTLSWAMGKPYHEGVCDECCPDFSCCISEMFTEDKDERWRIYRETKERLAKIKGETDDE